MPPLGMINRDPDAKWTKWDFKLVTGLELYDNLATGSGFPVYIDQSDRVRFELNSYVSKSKAVLDRAEENASKGTAKNHGKVFYVTPETIDGGPLPTLEEYLEEKARKDAQKAGNFRASDRTPFTNAGWTPPEG